MLPYTDPDVGLRQAHFCYPYQFHGRTELNENIIQNLPSN